MDRTLYRYPADRRNMIGPSRWEASYGRQASITASLSPAAMAQLRHLYRLTRQRTHAAGLARTIIVSTLELGQGVSY